LQDHNFFIWVLVGEISRKKLEPLKGYFPKKSHLSIKNDLAIPNVK
jgi:hypothetical protein